MVLTGDGSAYGMGLSATSGAMDRDLDFIYVCYDNEGYGNTGQQYSSATPHGASTATSRGSRGYPGYKKDLFASGRPPASLCRHRHRQRTAGPGEKDREGRDMHGPRMIIALSPCPTGWDYDPQRIGRDRPARGQNRCLAL